MVLVCIPIGLVLGLLMMSFFASFGAPLPFLGAWAAGWMLAVLLWPLITTSWLVRVIRWRR
jgi:hypothetical protein